MMLPLPPLRNVDIPAGWLLLSNELREVNPQILAANDPDWELLTEDLLQVTQPTTGLTLDLGWFPEASPNGQFRLVVIRGTEWAAPLVEFRTQSVDDVTARLNEILANPPTVEPLPPAGEPSLTDLVVMLDNTPDVQGAKRAASLLAERFPGASVPFLIERLDNKSPQVRWAIVNALQRIADPASGPALLARLLLPETDPDARRLLIRALGTIHHSPASEVLTALLRDPDSQQREAAAFALGALDAKEALDAVVEAYAVERDRHTREQLRITLNRLAFAGGS
jgi:HEAT repeats